jgi:hypothetical protein
MVSIQVDEQTAAGLERQAKSAGLTVADYLRSLVPPRDTTDRPSWDDLENEFIALSSHGPSLPADFSRADIYLNHD